MIARVLDENGSGVTIREIARSVGLARSTVTATLERVSAAGLI